MIENSTTRIPLPYLGSSCMYCLHLEVERAMTNMCDETDFFSRSFLTHSLWRLFSYSIQKCCHYQVHFIKICTEIRDYSNSIFYFILSFAQLFTGAYPCDHWEMNAHVYFDSSFLSWKYQYLEGLLYEKFLHTKKTKGSWTKAILGMQF